MLWVGFEPTIPALEQANSVHALDRAATVIRIFFLLRLNIVPSNQHCQWLFFPRTRDHVSHPYTLRIR
jgi:hypothetical protein